MFYGRADAVAVDADSLYYDFYSSISGEWGKADTSFTNTSWMYMYFVSYMPTSAGSYV